MQGHLYHADSTALPTGVLLPELRLLNGSFEQSSTSMMTPGTQPASELFLTLLFLALAAFQCSLLHPQFRHSRPARWTRASLGPLTISWWCIYPFRYAVLPVESNYSKNLTNGIFAVAFIMKSVEWSFVKGPYYMRELKGVNGVLRFEKEPGPDQASKSEANSFGELAWWTLGAILTQRGLRYCWGPASNANTLTFGQTLLGAIQLQLVFIPALWFLLYSLASPSGSPTHALISLGVPSFGGLAVLARCIHSVCFGLFISSVMEILNSVIVIICHLIYPCALVLRLPIYVCSVFNPLHYPPLYNSIFNLSSLAHFWGKSWHFKWRRSFLVCGGKPAEGLARCLGATYQVQRIFGLIGVFAASGLYHEYPLFVSYQAPHPSPRSLFRTFPGAFVFFILQAVGILVEPFIIPHIPKSLGGGRVWTLFFLLTTVPMFAKEGCLPGGYLTTYLPLNQWRWYDLLIPAPFITSFQNTS